MIDPELILAKALSVDQLNYQLQLEDFVGPSPPQDGDGRFRELSDDAFIKRFSDELLAYRVIGALYGVPPQVLISPKNQLCSASEWSSHFAATLVKLAVQPLFRAKSGLLATAIQYAVICRTNSTQRLRISDETGDILFLSLFYKHIENNKANDHEMLPGYETRTLRPAVIRQWEREYNSHQSVMSSPWNRLFEQIESIQSTERGRPRTSSSVGNLYFVQEVDLNTILEAVRTVQHNDTEYHSFALDSEAGQLEQWYRSVTLQLMTSGPLASVAPTTVSALKHIVLASMTSRQQHLLRYKRHDPQQQSSAVPDGAPKSAGTEPSQAKRPQTRAASASNSQPPRASIPPVVADSDVMEAAPPAPEVGTQKRRPGRPRRMGEDDNRQKRPKYEKRGRPPEAVRQERIRAVEAAEDALTLLSRDKGRVDEAESQVATPVTEKRSRPPKTPLPDDPGHDRHPASEDEDMGIFTQTPDGQGEVDAAPETSLIGISLLGGPRDTTAVARNTVELTAETLAQAANQGYGELSIDTQHRSAAVPVPSGDAAHGLAHTAVQNQSVVSTVPQTRSGVAPDSGGNTAPGQGQSAVSPAFMAEKEVMTTGKVAHARPDSEPEPAAKRARTSADTQPHEVMRKSFMKQELVGDVPQDSQTKEEQDSPIKEEAKMDT